MLIHVIGIPWVSSSNRILDLLSAFWFELLSCEIKSNDSYMVYISKRQSQFSVWVSVAESIRYDFVIGIPPLQHKWVASFFQTMQSSLPCICGSELPMSNPFLFKLLKWDKQWFFHWFLGFQHWIHDSKKKCLWGFSFYFSPKVCLWGFIYLFLENENVLKFAVKNSTVNHMQRDQSYKESLKIFVVRPLCLHSQKKEHRLCILPPLTLSTCVGMDYNYIIYIDSHYLTPK